MTSPAPSASRSAAGSPAPPASTASPAAPFSTSPDTCPLYPMLLADIGGTNVRLAVRPGPGEPIQAHRNYATASFRDMTEVVAAWIAEEGGRAKAGRTTAGPAFGRAVLAIAAPVTGGPIRLTNTAFTVDAADLARRFAPCRVHLMNDFEAQAWSLPTLGSGDYRTLGELAPTADQTMAVLGPGTGLGCAGLIRLSSGRWLPLPGEGGHMTLAPQTDLEAEVIAAARRDLAHVSAERLVSGSGLPLLYRSLALVRGEVADTGLDSGAAITAAAEHSALAAETLDVFGGLLGGFAGNIALALGAGGGVWIAGGIAPALFDRLQASPFRRRFEAKGRFAGYLSRIGTAVVTRRDPALDGLAYALESGSLG